MSLLDRLFPPRKEVKMTRTMLRWNLEVRCPGSGDMREGRGMKLTHRQCMDLLDILNELEAPR